MSSRSSIVFRCSIAFGVFAIVLGAAAAAPSPPSLYNYITGELGGDPAETPSSSSSIEKRSYYHAPHRGRGGRRPRYRGKGGGGEFVIFDSPEAYIDVNYGSGSDEHLGAIVSCHSGEVIDASGRCVSPLVTRNVFVYSPPDIPSVEVPEPKIPKPRVEYNVIFVRTPDPPKQLDPVVIPPPQLKTFVYVLTKNGKVERKVIEIPAIHEEKPEVIFVNYNEGDNPELSPYGLKLQQVLHHGGLSSSGENHHLHDHHHHHHRSEGGKKSLATGYASYSLLEGGGSHSDEQQQHNYQFVK